MGEAAGEDAEAVGSEGDAEEEELALLEDGWGGGWVRDCGRFEGRGRRERGESCDGAQCRKQQD